MLEKKTPPPGLIEHFEMNSKDDERLPELQTCLAMLQFGGIFLPSRSTRPHKRMFCIPILRGAELRDPHARRRAESALTNSAASQASETGGMDGRTLTFAPAVQLFRRQLPRREKEKTEQDTSSRQQCIACCSGGPSRFSVERASAEGDDPWSALAVTADCTVLHDFPNMRRSYITS